MSTSARPSAGRVRRHARVCARLVRALSATAWLSLVWAVGLPFHGGAPRRAWDARMYRGWASAMLRAAQVRVEIVGTPPPGPCLLVSNHLGYVDIPVLAASSGCVFVSMREIRNWPVFGWLAARMGTIFLQRERKRDLLGALDAMAAALQEGRIVAFFPEGRNGIGDTVQEFWPSLFAAPARLSTPIAWATLHYRTVPGDAPASRAVAWVNQALPGHLARFLALERVEARITFGAGAVSAGDRKQLALELRARVLERFEPLA
jgi:1-acyl-sn-glycerol-3-phosphate acyltransferase